MIRRQRPRAHQDRASSCQIQIFHLSTFSPQTAQKWTVMIFPWQHFTFWSLLVFTQASCAEKEMAALFTMTSLHVNNRWMTDSRHYLYRWVQRKTCLIFCVLSPNCKFTTILIVNWTNFEAGIVSIFFARTQRQNKNLMVACSCTRSSSFVKKRINWQVPEVQRLALFSFSQITEGLLTL